MIRVIGIVSILLLFFNPLEAQRFKAGLVAGVNLSQIDGDKLHGYNRVGLNAGARVAAMLADSGRWQLSMELLYSQRGSHVTTTDDPNSIYESIRLNTVQVPVMLNFKDWKLLFSAGLTYSRLINAKVIDRQGNDISDNQTYNNNIYGFVFGGTYFFREDMGLNVRWSKSFTDIQADDNDSSFIERNVAIRLLYIF